MNYSHTIGFIAGLSGATTWAIASVMFRRLGLNISPMLLNLYKGAIASFFLLIGLALFGELFVAIPFTPWIFLIISGMIGIGIGDTAFFSALNRLGERQTVIIAETIAPMLTIIFASMLLQEILNARELLAIAAIIFGVTLVVTDGKNSEHQQKTDWAGVGFGLLSAACQAGGGLLTKAAFQLYDINPVWSAFVRLLAGCAILIVLIPINKEVFFPKKVRSIAVWKLLVVASIIGTLGALVFQQIAYKFTFAAIAQTLIAMSAIVVLIISVIQKNHPSKQAWIGAFIAVGGAAVLFWLKG